MNKSFSALSISGVAILIAVVYEIYFSIPVVGFVSHWGSFGASTVTSFVLHIAVYYIVKSEFDIKLSAPFVGCVAGLISWVPIIGWLSHVVTLILYLIEFRALSGGVRMSSFSRSHVGGAVKSQQNENVRDAEIVD